MPAAKRKRGARGPAPGTGGRPVGERGPAVDTLTLRLYEADRARILRLAAAFGGKTPSEVVRRALEMADDMMREG
jgi:hypothetical protein